MLYSSGEESPRQIKLRAQRLGVAGESLYLLSETDLEDIIEAVHQVKPDILIVDSIADYEYRKHRYNAWKY